MPLCGQHCSNSSPQQRWLRVGVGGGWQLGEVGMSLFFSAVPPPWLCSAGSIPSVWGNLPYLEYVDIQNTQMSCCTSQQDVINKQGALLPSFLQPSDIFMYYDRHNSAAVTDMGSSTGTNATYVAYKNVVL
jgi:hypothetical protein